VSRDHGSEQDEDQRHGGYERKCRRNPIIDVHSLGVGPAHRPRRSRGLLGRRATPEAPACPLFFRGLAGLFGRSRVRRTFFLLLLEFIVPRLELVGKRLAVLLIAVGHALVSLLCSIGRLRPGRPGSTLGGAGFAKGENPRR
jgi:hypothetical protein